jgi:hypothetical protein
MNWGDLVLEGYEEGPLGGIKWGEPVIEGYEEIKRRFKHGCPRPVKRRYELGWPRPWGIWRRSREGINFGDLVLEGYEEGPMGGIKWVTLSFKDMKEVKRRYELGWPRPSGILRRL